MLTISKTPLRVSFFGGGTDYPSYLDRYSGAVLGVTINRYIYTIALPMAEFAERNFRVTYRNVDSVDTVEEISHPVVRAGLQAMDYRKPLNVAIISDLPGGTGLGSSSAFTVGFVNLIHHLKGVQLSRYDLAQYAIHLEHDVLKENVGVQDQVHASFGGLSHYTFQKREIKIRPVMIHTACRNYLNASMLLVYTGIERHASSVLGKQSESANIDNGLLRLLQLAEEGVVVLEQTSSEIMLRDLGTMLSEAWRTKREFSPSITNPHIDAVYDQGMTLGATGGKLCGAGGGGFFLFLVPPEKHERFIETFGIKHVVPVAMEEMGSLVTSG